MIIITCSLFFPAGLTLLMTSVGYALIFTCLKLSVKPIDFLVWSWFVIIPVSSCLDISDIHYKLPIPSSCR